MTAPSRLLCLVGLLLCAPAPAAPKKVRQLIILGGGKTEEEAKAALESAKAKSLYLELSAAAGFPKVVKSDDYKGLKPGLYVAAAGVCHRAPKDVAELVTKLRALSPGAYSRELKGEVQADCPEPSAFESKSEEELKLISAIDKERKNLDALFAYAVFLKEAARFKEATAVLERMEAVKPGEKRAADLQQVIWLISEDLPEPD